MFLGLAGITNLMQYVTPVPVCIFLFVPLLVFLGLAVLFTRSNSRGEHT